MSRKLLPILTLGVSAITFALPSMAAGTATITANGQAMQFVWQDGGSARFDLPAADGAYLVLRAGKVYMVNAAAGGGMPPVMEISGGLQGLAQGFAADKKNPLGKIESATATGARETVGGIEGEVYEVTITDAQGKTQTRQVVLTSDPLVTEMTAAYVAITSAMAGPEAAKFQQDLPTGKRGLLRVGDDMAVQAISQKSPATGAFDLPAEPVNMQDMMQQLMKGLKQ